ncbi:hypothetical protein CYMTET_12185 [Cymbomonas tetramitiformis]|uniref:Uncharacterized protein n=1 Tax=Cymbomonas tetramitiformis TaxID=36881 RepID=A0AAE0GKS3_9CHLO|nr:hypothetical protein CYMTET_12185 [Cymbomonas tetramitiformis]
MVQQGGSEIRRTVTLENAAVKTGADTKQDEAGADVEVVVREELVEGERRVTHRPPLRGEDWAPREQAGVTICAQRVARQHMMCPTLGKPALNVPSAEQAGVGCAQSWASRRCMRPALGKPALHVPSVGQAGVIIMRPALGKPVLYVPSAG